MRLQKKGQRGGSLVQKIWGVSKKLHEKGGCKKKGNVAVLVEKLGASAKSCTNEKGGGWVV